MLYLLWSVFIGIICGCQLFEVGVLTSIVVTIVLIALEHINFGGKSIVLIVRSKDNIENELTEYFKSKKKIRRFFRLILHHLILILIRMLLEELELFQFLSSFSYHVFVSLITFSFL